MKTMQLWSISVQSPCINVDGDDETLDDQSIDWSPSENGKEIDGTKIELGRDLSLSLSLTVSLAWFLDVLPRLPSLT